MATLEQQIAQKQDELNRLKEKAKTLENGQKSFWVVWSCRWLVRTHNLLDSY